MFMLLLQLLLCRMYFFSLYLQTGSFPKPLNEKEETAVFLAFKNGDKSAREKLINHNLRLVAHIVKKYYAADCEQDDLISIGTIGLIKAVDSFKMEGGTKFSTYAARCIENEILMYFRSQKKTKGTLSLQDTIDNDAVGNTLVVGDVIAQDCDLHERYELTEEKVALLKFVEKLDERDKQIIIMRFGLHGTYPNTQMQVAKKLGISRSYVSRLETKALLKLKYYINKSK